MRAALPLVRTETGAVVLLAAVLLPAAPAPAVALGAPTATRPLSMRLEKPNNCNRQEYLQHKHEHYRADKLGHTEESRKIDAIHTFTLNCAVCRS